MREKFYYTAEEVSQMLGISRAKAYKILQQMNADLEEKGYLIVRGKIPVAYFREKWYGAEREEATV